MESNFKKGTIYFFTLINMASYNVIIRQFHVLQYLVFLRYKTLEQIRGDNSQKA